jgi:hypothetical protein
MPFMPDDHVSGGVLRGMVGDVDPDAITQKTAVPGEDKSADTPEGKTAVVHEEHPESPGVSFKTTFI